MENPNFPTDNDKRKMYNVLQNNFWSNLNKCKDTRPYLGDNQLLSILQRIQKEPPKVHDFWSDNRVRSVIIALIKMSDGVVEKPPNPPNPENFGAFNAVDFDPLLANSMAETIKNLISSGDLEGVEKIISSDDFHFFYEGDDLGYTAIHHAASQGQLQILRLLLSRGIDVNMTSKYGLTPLICSIISNKPQVICFLLENKVKRFSLKNIIEL